ncbi:MAG: hypothetical protein AAFZ15_16375 [Bacteroidota bacterium]
MFKRYCLLFLSLISCLSLKAQNDFVPEVRLVPSVYTGHDCYAPFRFGDKIYFTSKYPQGPTLPPGTRLLNTEVNKQGTNLLEINPAGNTTYASNMTLSVDGKTMYYTLCADSTQNDCAIWSRKKSYYGGWEAAIKLPAHINLRGYTATQPSIGYDRDLKKKVLYFVSDRPSGKGGMDIWRSVIELDGTYQRPTSLPFNTRKDEVTPFFQLSEQVLFFSSNGMRGHGGFDIFSTKKIDGDQWQKVENQGAVINSEYDETYFMYHTILQKSYFASSRPVTAQSAKLRSEGRMNIYEIDPVVEIELPVYNIHNSNILHNTMAHVYDESTGRKTIFREQPFDRNLKVALYANRIYKIVVLKDGFMPSVIETSTEGVLFPVSRAQEVQLFVDEALTYSNRETYHEKEKDAEQETAKAMEVGGKAKGRRVYEQK